MMQVVMINSEFNLNGLREFCPAHVNGQWCEAEAFEVPPIEENWLGS